MEIGNFRNQGGRNALFSLGILVLLPSYMWLARTHRWVDGPPNGVLMTYGGAALLLWVLALGLRVSLKYYPDQRLLQWSYQLFGGQFASREVSLEQVLGTGLRYWRTKEVHYQPVLALTGGKLTPIGDVVKVWSLTGGGDLSTFRAAKQQADSVARALGVESLVTDPDTSMTVVAGQAVVTENHRQSQIAWNSVVLAAVAAIVLIGLMAGFSRG